jgi:hypothetical protein
MDRIIEDIASGEISYGKMKYVNDRNRIRMHGHFATSSKPGATGLTNLNWFIKLVY